MPFLIIKLSFDNLKTSFKINGALSRIVRLHFCGADHHKNWSTARSCEMWLVNWTCCIWYGKLVTGSRLCSQYWTKTSMEHAGGECGLLNILTWSPCWVASQVVQTGQTLPYIYFRVTSSVLILIYLLSQAANTDVGVM